MNKGDTRFAILFAIVIGFILNWIFADVSGSTKLLFWGGYLCGIYALIVGNYAIKHSNRNNENAIKQQTKILNRQHEEKWLDQYNECLKNNLELLNVVNVKGILATLKYDGSVVNKAEIVKKKALIYSYDLQFRYISKIDIHGCSSEVEKKYFDCWNKAQKQLSEILDLQLSLIQRIQQNYFDCKMKGVSQNKEIEIIDERISKYNNDCEEIFIKIDPQYEKLLNISKQLFDFSLLIIEEKEKIIREKFK